MRGKEKEIKECRERIALYERQLAIIEEMIDLNENWSEEAKRLVIYTFANTMAKLYPDMQVYRLWLANRDYDLIQDMRDKIDVIIK